MSGTSQTTRTIAGCVLEARALLQDTDSTDGYRYSDQDMIDAFNDAMAETRSKRPDFFLDIGLRTPPTFYTTAHLNNVVPFPLDVQVYSAFVYYLTGRAELREDEYTEDGRAVAMMNKFVSQITKVVS
jgi:hypothetical protein